MSAKTLPTQAHVVVIGGRVIGCSIGNNFREMVHNHLPDYRVSFNVRGDRERA